MKYQIRKPHLPYLQVNNVIDEFSFVRNHPTRQKDLTPRLQSRQNSGQLSSSDQTRSSQNRYRQSMQVRKSIHNQKQMFDRSNGLRQSANQRKQTEQNYQHLFQRQSTNGSSCPPTQVLKHQDLRQSGEQIYQEIIRVLQMENANLKQQNQYFIHEHKRILKQNSKLRYEVEELKGINGLHIQIKKLKDINQAYQNQVEELKFILMQEIVAIHQKFNMYMSQEQASLIYHELNDSIKLSASRINTDRFTFVDPKQRKDNRTPSTRTNSGMILAEMLEINQSDIFEKSPGKTAQTLDKQNILNCSNFDLKFNDSPTQTTFSGHLRISN